jgi:hypothetical protein
MRIFLKPLLFLIAAFSFVHISNAQKTPDKKPVTSTQKFKPPKLYTYLGSYKDSVSIPVEVAENIIASPLKIYDDKKVEYKVSSYQFLYRKNTVTEDEQSGKVSPASSLVSDRFTATPLPALWVDQVKEQVKPGEELYFFDVIAKDAQGRVMYAPNLKIITR